VEYKKNVGITLIVDSFPLTVAAETEARACSGSGREVRLPAILREGQIPLPSLLLATVLSASLWWGIIAGMRWIWLAI
jgi:hypothetical protein